MFGTVTKYWKWSDLWRINTIIIPLLYGNWKSLEILPSDNEIHKWIPNGTLYFFSHFMSIFSLWSISMNENTRLSKLIFIRVFGLLSFSSLLYSQCFSWCILHMFHLFQVKLPAEYKMTKNCVYSIPCNCGKIYRGRTWTSKSSKPRWGQKVRYDWPYMERKGKPSALTGWS